jgi:hypothetical protein
LSVSGLIGITDTAKWQMWQLLAAARHSGGYCSGACSPGSQSRFGSGVGQRLAY